jgi:hypothetical protein
MKRFLFILGAALILFVAALGLAYIFSATLLSRSLSKQLGTRVTVGQAVFGWNTLSFRNIVVASPKASMPPALTISRAYLTAPLPNYLKSITYIDKVEINDTVLTVVFNPLKTSNNWDKITKNMSKESTSKSHKYALISLLEFNRLTIRVLIPGLPPQETVIPQLTFKNIKSSEGDVAKKISQIIIYQMLFNAKNLLNIPLPLFDPSKGPFDPLSPFNPF